MSTHDMLTRNRVILCHFDSYSHALLFPRWAHGMLWPAGLPEGTEPMPAPVEPLTGFEGTPLKQALVDATGLNPDELAETEGFVAWFLAPDGPLRVHLLHFTTPDAPKPAIEALGGRFMAMSQLRGTDMTELLLLRQAFGLFGHG